MDFLNGKWGRGGGTEGRYHGGTWKVRKGFEKWLQNVDLWVVRSFWGFDSFVI